MSCARGTQPTYSKFSPFWYGNWAWNVVVCIYYGWKIYGIVVQLSSVTKQISISGSNAHPLSNNLLKLAPDKKI
jgi:hypothetical protein